MHEIRINPIAKKYLQEIKAYITEELEYPDAAVGVITGISDSYQKLSSKIGITTDYRYLVSGKYLIFYKIDDIYVSIYRILYRKGDYVKLLWEEEYKNIT